MGQGDKTGLLTPALCLAGRAFVDWTQAELAARAGVSRSTIRDFEGNRHEIHRATAGQLRAALEAGGAVFHTVDGYGLAVGGNLTDEAP